LGGREVRRRREKDDNVDEGTGDVKRDPTRVESKVKKREVLSLDCE
jgi:hypothetical protein